MRCRLCREVIGVYEPMVAPGDGGWHETSLLNVRAEGSVGEHCYHRDCFHRAREGNGSTSAT